MRFFAWPDIVDQHGDIHFRPVHLITTTLGAGAILAWLALSMAVGL